MLVAEIFFALLLFPCFLVLVTQIFCVQQLLLSNHIVRTETSNELWALKILMVIFFFFMSMKEVSAAFDAIGFFYKFTFYSKNQNNSLINRIMNWINFFIRISPQFFQIFLSFLISYVNIILIDDADDPTDLIQNFAGLTILLEFDNLVMAFFRHIRFFTFFQATIELLDKKQENKSTMEEKIARYRKNILYLRYMHKSLQNDQIEEYEDAQQKYEDEENKIVKQNVSNNAKNIAQVQNTWDRFYNIMKQIIIDVGQKEEIKSLLTKSEIKISEEFLLEGNTKLCFSIISVLTMIVGITIIGLVFF